LRLTIQLQLVCHLLAIYLVAAELSFACANQSYHYKQGQITMGMLAS